MARKKCADDTPFTVSLSVSACSHAIARDATQKVLETEEFAAAPPFQEHVGNRGGAERNCGPRRDPRELRTLQFFYTMSVWEKVNRNGRLESAPRGVRRQFGTRGKRGTVSTAKTGSLSFKSLLVRMTSPRCRFPRAFAGFLHVELEISWKEPCIPRKRQS
ncbi:hypothetical protein WN943_014085 [Citrus x changshan-huyou]